MSVAPEQVCAYSDPEHGKTGLWYMVQVAGHLLNPVGSEFTASFVGRLITTLIQKAGIERLGTDLDALLKAVLSKLQVKLPNNLGFYHFQKNFRKGPITYIFLWPI